MKQTFRPFRSALQIQGNDVVGKVIFAEDFFSDSECDRALDLASHIKEEEGHEAQEGDVASGRFSQIRFLLPGQDNDWLFTRLEDAVQRLNQSYRFDLLGFYEGAQIARYQSGGHYDWHVDLGTQTRSARKLSISIQLSEPTDYEGGDLEFIGSTDEKAPRSRGALIAFPSFVAHKVHPVTRGERFSLVSWISGRPFR